MPLTMSEKKAVTNQMRDEYKKASKKRKGQMLDEFVKLTGYNRSYGARKLRSPKVSRIYKRHKKVLQKPRGRKRFYGEEMIDPLRKIWASMDFACASRVAGGMEDMLDAMLRHGELAANAEVLSKLKTISASTIDRLLAPTRKNMQIKGRSTTKPGSLLKSQIPIRRGTEWDDAKIGFVEIDLVAHCGTTTKGQYANTLDVTDIMSGWSEQRAVINKARVHVIAALKNVKESLPFKLLGVDSDNGSEFINDHLLTWCTEEDLVFTRGRSGEKNDGCYVEQKNWSIVRQNVGYKRFETQREVDILNMMYDLISDHNNFFMPSVKLESKERDGSRIIKKYSKPMTPYRRLLASDDINQKTKDRLTKLFKQLNPSELRREIVRLRDILYGYTTMPQDRERGNG